MTFNQFSLYRKITRKYIKILLFLFLLSLSYPIRTIIFPKIILYIFDMIKKPGTLGKCITIFLITYGLIYLTMVIYEICMILMIKVNVKKEILDIFYKKIFRGLESNYTEIPGPNVFSNIFHFANNGQNVFSYFFSNVFPYIITFLLVGGYFIITGYPIIGISLILINLIIFGLPLLYVKILKKTTSNLVSVRNQTEINIYDIFWNIYNILSLNQQKQEIENIEYMTNKIKDYSKTRWTTTFFSIILGRLIMIFFVCGVIYYIFKSYKNKLITFSVLSNLVLTIVFISQEFFHTYYIWNGLIIELLEQQQMIEEINKSVTSINNNNKDIIETKNKTPKNLLIKNLSFNYPNTNTDIFNNLNLEFKSKKSYAIIGHIGSGKSSLLKMLFGIYKPKKGDIIIGGNKHINKTNNRDWRNHFNYLQQTPVLFGRRVDDNICYGNSKYKIKDCINKLGLAKNINKIRKEKKNIKLKKLGEGLSGGQKQIINLLRIITKPKDIILMDEPTSNLDPETREVFYKMFNFLKKRNKIIILVTHDIKLANLCDTKIDFDNNFKYT